METGIIIEMVLLILVMVTTVGTNVITLFVIACTDYLRNINRVYLYSVTISDLCVGLFIFPFALYSLIINSLGYPEINQKLCHLQAYTLVVLFLSGLYAIAWTNVDHYVAVRKPERYKVMMSPPRSLCWMGFAWIAAISFCSPPMLSFQDTRYYNEVFVCTIYIGSEIPYFITAGVLALIPPLLVLIVTDVYLFTHGFKKKQKMYEAVLLDVSSRPRNYQINFLVSVIYFGTWLPWCLIRFCSLFEESIPQELHFVTFWIAMGNGFYKFFIYTAMSVEYRRGLRELLRHCCSHFKCNCCDTVLPTRQNLTVNLTATRLVAKPSTSGPPPTIV
ncbi:substance-K receptor-like [Mercenaria mercenaria]|uniref:substance-K receptor-like n=1 Tax=Mercenaria mercenaria TaxID=6596 RepID=UPI001E1DE086|nr:substance-K receptor-like [Mercenaria mercenaria]XP_053380896.1 substance-K receptor-like [Mercenaria mercenaria]